MNRIEIERALRELRLSGIAETLSDPVDPCAAGAGQPRAVSGDLCRHAAR